MRIGLCVITMLWVVFWSMLAYDFFDNDCILVNTDKGVAVECAGLEEVTNVVN